MGYFCHHAIIVTTYEHALADEARQRALEIFGPAQVTDRVGPTTNMFFTFLVGPDGSKEGWDESDAGDCHRLLFVAWLEERHEQYWWAEVQYADDEGDDRILRTDRGPLVG